MSDAQRIWKNLRDRYSKERKTIVYCPSGSGAPPPESAWPLYQYMSFMAKHMLSRKYVINDLLKSYNHNFICIAFRRTSNLSQVAFQDSISRPSSVASNISQSSTTVSSPLMSPRDMQSPIQRVFDSYSEITSPRDIVSSEAVQEDIEESEEDSTPAKQQKVDKPNPAVAAVGQYSTPSTSKVQQQKRQKTTTTGPQVEKTLNMLQSYLVEKQQPSKNLAFGQYIGLTLDDMPAEEQNFKKLKMVEILHQPYKQ